MEALAKVGTKAAKCSRRDIPVSFLEGVDRFGSVWWERNILFLAFWLSPD